jgi:hypothetical protein
MTLDSSIESGLRVPSAASSLIIIIKKQPAENAVKCRPAQNTNASADEQRAAAKLKATQAIG